MTKHTRKQTNEHTEFHIYVWDLFKACMAVFCVCLVCLVVLARIKWLQKVSCTCHAQWCWLGLLSLCYVLSS